MLGKEFVVAVGFVVLDGLGESRHWFNIVHLIVYVLDTVIISPRTA